MNFIDASLTNEPPAHISAFVKGARESLTSLPQPSRKDEDWRFLKLKPLFSQVFTTPEPSKSFSTPIPEAEKTTLSIINGVVNLPSSNLSGLHNSIFVGSLEDAPSYVFEALEKREDSPFKDEYFDTLNRASLSDIACVFIDKDQSQKEPIHIAYSTHGDTVSVSPRLIILVESGSSLSVVETWEGKGAYLNLSSTECVVHENSTLTHVRIQDEDLRSSHIARVSVEVHKGATYDSVSVAFGAKLSRTDYVVSHLGPGSDSRVDGLAAIGLGQVSDTHSLIDNRSAHCQSHQLHKCVIDGDGHAVFNGRICVQKHAQKIDAYQLNRNLLLSDKAKINTKPQLEILADDVRCSHGATIGQLDDEQLFYLQSRGLPYEESRALLTYAFAAEVLTHIKIKSLRERLEAMTKLRTQGRQNV